MAASTNDEPELEGIMSVETSSNAMSLPIRKSFVLGVLYFIQGLPYGLQDKFIPLMLIMKGHSHSTVALTRLLLLPWLMKPLFAPLIDTVNVFLFNSSPPPPPPPLHHHHLAQYLIRIVRVEKRIYANLMCVCGLVCNIDTYGRIALI